MELLNKKAVHNFCEYLKIDTKHPNPDYSKAVEFLKEQSIQLDLEFQIIELVPNNPIVFLKWNGKNKNFKKVILMSHMDVVPVFEDQWKYPPFSAHIDENGNIFARGSQDMKCVGSQYLEAIRRIKAQSPTYIPERDIYVMFVPDEEVGGKKGVKLFVNTDIFQNMNIGIVMDEGLANPGEEYSAYYGDRVCWWIQAHITGGTGHGSQFIKNSVGVKMRLILDKFMNFRDEEECRMIDNGLSLGDVTTINLTGVNGGVQHNVVPSPIILNFDIRITPTMDLIKFQQMLDEWAKEAGGGIEYKFVQHESAAYLTTIDNSNHWWTEFEKVCKSLEMKIVPQVFPAGTDGRFIRQKGIPVFGFSPMNRTPILLHDHNEFLNVDTFLRGIDFYQQLIPALAAVKE